MAAPLQQSHHETVIIGAGMAGMAAGIRLALAGRDVLILERHNASGGLNSFYSIAGRKYDVGLHAMTNYVPKGTKGTPLTKLLRQLRIPYDALDLCPQLGSRIAFNDCNLKFSNDFALLESEVAANFPKQIDGFRSLTEEIREMNPFQLKSGHSSARGAVQRHIKDSLLEDMLFCPVMYYGSAEEHDMDFGQFAIMFRSLFFEGFARPFDGVRVIIRLLQDQYRSLGGQRKMKCGVQSIHSEKGRATSLTLDDGTTLTADSIISTAGSVETARLCNDQTKDVQAENIGQLSFTETITAFEKQPQELGWEDTIIFFNTRKRFHYARVPSGVEVDPTSGVICLPNNYHYGTDRQLNEGLLRVTALANYEDWCALDENDYRSQKEHWYASLMDVALAQLPSLPKGEQFHEHIVAKDMFTPRTVHKFTGHLNGAIYGASQKQKDGRTHLENLFLAGTDQGFLGITGAMLSGISIANRYLI
ncbi:MAG: Phytoene desaturase (lycopene-forming) [Opitutia bacterium UBA7350]|nr:MAG: Phytoene desaturase (lycopene-forming) [Opitutae bacterium UBA7350]